MTFKYHRIVELEMTLKGHLAQLSCNEQEHPELNQGARSPSTLSLDVSRDRAIHCLSGHPVPVLRYPQCNKLLPYIQSVYLEGRCTTGKDSEGADGQRCHGVCWWEGKARESSTFLLASKEECWNVYRLFCHWPSLPGFVPVSFFSQNVLW